MCASPYRPPMYRMGQFGESFAGPLASRIVEEAAPKLRALVQEERARLASSLQSAVPYAAIGALGLVGGATVAPPGAARTAAYAASAALLAYGGWTALSGLADAGPEREEGGDLPLVQPVVDAAARRIGEELDPRIARILAEERARVAEATKAGLPFFAGSALAGLGTWFLVPEGRPTAKFAGYGAAALAFALGLWRVLDEESVVQ